MGSWHFFVIVIVMVVIMVVNTTTVGIIILIIIVAVASTVKSQAWHPASQNGMPQHAPVKTQLSCHIASEDPPWWTSTIKRNAGTSYDTQPAICDMHAIDVPSSSIIHQ